MNKLLTLVFLGLLLAILRLSAPAPHHKVARFAAPTRYAAGLPATTTTIPTGSKALDGYLSRPRLLVTAQ
ncbi:hypothetical protein [Hymenobacter psoromatis]|uniref:hypothetical protein n=1 Tax=Hymenobacter psoromatis TaxID=1484116 RepID=UPI001CC14B4B|nr:hypothetical protein [Hymenobacter psoromatis]